MIFHFYLRSDESGFAMAYQRLHDLVIFMHFIDTGIYQVNEPDQTDMEVSVAWLI